jgi:hypothetical protein
MDHFGLVKTLMVSARARAVRMVLDYTSEYPSRWAAVTSIVAKIRLYAANAA